MSTSSNEQGRGSHLLDHEQATAALTKADQMAWEAPELRETFTMNGASEKWALPCPEWCLGLDYEGHSPDRLAENRSREHGGPVFRVRQDGARGYYDEIDAGHGNAVEGISAAHLSVRLVASSREHLPRIRMSANWGDADGDHKEFKLNPLYFDEVRELIAVLQHLLKVGQEL